MTNLDLSAMRAYLTEQTEPMFRDIIQELLDLPRWQNDPAPEANLRRLHGPLVEAFINATHTGDEAANATLAEVLGERIYRSWEAGMPMKETQRGAAIYRRHLTNAICRAAIVGVPHADVVLQMANRACDLSLDIIADLYTKQLEETIERQRLFSKMVETSIDGISFSDASVKITYANPAFTHMLGYDNLIGRPVADILEPDALEEIRSAVWPALRSTRTWNGELSYRHADGSIFPVQISIVAIHDEKDAYLGNAVIVRDLREQHAKEAERVRLQEQIISMQETMLRELSTPLLTISDETLVMPLVGAIDSRRAQQIMETLLEGIAMQQAETAIIDITGVNVVDTRVADAIVRAAQAVRLLGADVILTGIRAEVAQTLVGMGAQLHDIVTLSTLQAGIAFAIDKQQKSR